MYYENLHDAVNGVRTDHVISLNTGMVLKGEEVKPMVDAKGYFGGNYLKSADIKRDLSITIKETKVEQLDGKEKLVVYFEEIDKGLVLNKINMTRISKWAGGSSMTENWNGLKITLVTSEVEYDGKDVPCIRVKKKEEA